MSRPWPLAADVDVTVHINKAPTEFMAFRWYGHIICLYRN